MKRILQKALPLLLVFSMLFGILLPAAAAQPHGYWPYHLAYTQAVEKGDVDEILRTGDALLDFYSKFEINFDIAANSYNVYYYRYAFSRNAATMPPPPTT